MAAINRLSIVDQIQGSDQVPIWCDANGDPRRAPVTLFTAYIQAQIVIAITPIVTAAIAAALADLPTVLPGAPGILRNNGGVVSIS